MKFTKYENKCIDDKKTEDDHKHGGDSKRIPEEDKKSEKEYA